MKRRERGHALIEMAISMTVMVTLLAGIFQMGYVFYSYNQLVTAVGNGGRFAATAARDDVDAADRAIRNVVAYGVAQPAPGATPLIADLKPELVDVRWVKGEDGAISAVNISIREYTVDSFFRVFKFSGRPGVQFPYIGAPPAAASASNRK